MLSGDGPVYLIDSSVLLRAGFGDSPAALAWFEDDSTAQRILAGSRWLATECRRAVTNRELRGEPVDRLAVVELLGLIAFSGLDDALAGEAESLRLILRAGDAIHVATALRLQKHASVVLVTHDVEMASAARTLNIRVLDPVTDDPHRGPVTASTVF